MNLNNMVLCFLLAVLGRTSFATSSSSCSSDQLETASAGVEQTGGRRIKDLPPFAQEVANGAFSGAEPLWDKENNLIRYNGREKGSTRDSLFYALGLLMRGDVGDQEKAVTIIDAVLSYQIDELGAVYHGTFYQSSEKKRLTKKSKPWKDFDPNWRQFIGTALAILLEDYSDELPDELVKRMDRAVQLAVEGEPADRCSPKYSNIAIMKAGLMTWAGHRYGRDEWTKEGEAFAQQVYELFVEHGTFEEYNSPTYYSVDLFGLSFWRQFSHSPSLAKWGAEMEEVFWQDTAQFYHAGLRNMCGPFTRAYGMNMNDYPAGIGIYIWLGVGRDLAPVQSEMSSDRFHKYMRFALLNTKIPADVLPDLKSFSGERLVEKRISTIPDRVATAWLGEKVMFGGEVTPLDGDKKHYKYYKKAQQFHPVTMHWEMPDGRVGWMRLRHVGMVSARASKGNLLVTSRIEKELLKSKPKSHPKFVFEVSVPGGLDAKRIQPDKWDLPGLSLRVESNVSAMTVERDGDVIKVIYLAPEKGPDPRFEFAVE